MAGYRDELEKLGFSSAEKAELARRLAAGRPGAERRRMRLPYRGLVAVVAAASLLIGAAGAASLAGVSPAFRELFGITSEEQVQNLGAEQMNLVFEDQNGSGATITVKEAVMDQEQLYLRVEFAAPDGVILPEPDPVEEGRTPANLWGGDGGMDLTCCFYSDKSCSQSTSVGSYGYGFKYLGDDDPTDNRAEFLFHISCTESIPEEAAYCQISGVESMYIQYEGAWTALVEGMDIDMVIPLPERVGYDFTGRCGVNLGGEALAMLEELSVSPISVTFDLIIYDGDAYDAALEEYGPWEAYILLLDGTRVETEFNVTSSRKWESNKPGEEGRVYFRADHVQLALESPIDVSQIDDIVFAGDNSRDYSSEPGGMGASYFHFWPTYFYNSTYWNGINEAWRI